MALSVEHLFSIALWHADATCDTHQAGTVTAKIVRASGMSVPCQPINLARLIGRSVSRS